MKKSVAKLWVEALRSGKYEQGQKNLHTLEDQFCCLGVLCDITKVPKLYFDKESGWVYGHNPDDVSSKVLPQTLCNELGITVQCVNVAIPVIWAKKHQLMRYLKSQDIIDGYVHVNLAELNDQGVSFELIAKIIDKFWEEM